ncbi:hypothetical protein OHB12_07070 [Nocardia sp. NBC_01730]|uniref:hypothetical protein n=1 Tax=Nocardia sp. NBC_01730 TaxID=2975998 RepID=UPI002E165FB3|nr:hypothetical protein OHB12_07070 [Nocardia sp. NBC_01730]
MTPGITDRLLTPAGAHWVSSGSAHNAYYAYDVACGISDPIGSALGFFQSAYMANPGILKLAPAPK